MRMPLAAGGALLQPSKLTLATHMLLKHSSAHGVAATHKAAFAHVCCMLSLAPGAAGYAQMASLVVSWTRMLDEVQATAEDRPQAEFEHDEAHFLRVCTLCAGCRVPCLPD